MSTRSILVAASLGAVASAFSLSSLTPACQTGVTRLINDPNTNACIAGNQLLNIFLAPADETAVKTTANWLDAFCGVAPECSPASIEQAVTNVGFACAEDLSSYGLNMDHLTKVLPYIQKYWSTAKEVVCLSDTSVNEYCAPSIAANLELALSTNVSVNWIANEIRTSIENRQFSVPADVACVPCIQAALVKADSTELWEVVDLKGFAANTCGAAFADVTEIPPTVVVGIADNAPQAPADAASVLSVALPMVATIGALVAALL